VSEFYSVKNSNIPIRAEIATRLFWAFPEEKDYHMSYKDREDLTTKFCCMFL